MSISSACHFLSLKGDGCDYNTMRTSAKERCHVDYIICPVAGPLLRLDLFRLPRLAGVGFILCFNATHKEGSEDIITCVIMSQRCVKLSYVFLSAYCPLTATLHHNATRSGLSVRTSSRLFTPHPLASKHHIAFACPYCSQSQSADSPSSDKYALQEILSIRSS